MKAVIQRISKGSIIVDNDPVSSTSTGIIVFLGIKKGDSAVDITYLVRKIVNLRIFEDKQKKMNHSVKDINGDILVVSQFTLYGNCKKGTRPSYDQAEEPQKAKKLYDEFVEEIKKYNLPVQTGIFKAEMKVSIDIEGPVTIIIETP